MIPPFLLSIVGSFLVQAGDATSIQDVAMVEGGCISHTLRLVTDRASYFLKWDARPLPRLFTAEREGLALLRATGAVRIPQVLAAVNQSGDNPGFILQEWIEPEDRLGDWDARLGRTLAEMHHRSAVAAPPDRGYGLQESNYLGLVQQLGGWDRDWTRFFEDRRLRPQVSLAAQKGLLSPTLQTDLEKLMDRLPEWLDGVDRQPALLHGDLWAGNVLWTRGGELALVDPAAYYGDREAELAYTELFGGFPQRFYDAYESAWPTAPGREDRRDLYNLYHLLNHLNHFGVRYLPQVENVVKKFVT